MKYKRFKDKQLYRKVTTLTDKLQHTKQDRQTIRENLEQFFKDEYVGIEELEKVEFKDIEGEDGIVTTTTITVKSHSSEIGLHDLSNKVTIFRVKKLEEYRMWKIHISDRELLENEA